MCEAVLGEGGEVPSSVQTTRADRSRFGVLRSRVTSGKKLRGRGARLPPASPQTPPEKPAGQERTPLARYYKFAYEALLTFKVA